MYVLTGGLNNINLYYIFNIKYIIICFGLVHTNLPPKPKQKISIFKKMKTYNEPNQNFGNGSANFGQFFWFVSFVHTP